MSIKCGNPKHQGIDIRHETVADVRACYASPNGVADFAPTTEGVRFPQAPEPDNGAYLRAEEEVWPWLAPTTAPASAKSPSYPAKKPISDRPFKLLGVAYAEALRADPEIDKTAILAKPIESLLNSGATPSARSWNGGYPATEAQKSFLAILEAERDHEPFETPISELTTTEASARIHALKAAPRVGKGRGQCVVEQPWKTLSQQVPAGYYVITDEAGKNHFYRVSSSKTGFFKIQEQASSELHYIRLGRYAGILQSLLDFGLDKAGILYSTERKACRKCNRELTDNTGNPYFAMGYGPYCGG